MLADSAAGRSGGAAGGGSDSGGGRQDSPSGVRALADSADILESSFGGSEVAFEFDLSLIHI
eukprot:3183266-Prymnesium_polylepis.1